MILDRENNFTGAAGQAITATAASTDVIDFGAAGTPPQGLEMLYRKETGTWKPLDIVVTTAFTAAGAATMVVDLQVDDDVAFGSAQTLWTSGAIAGATLVAGYRFLIDKIPPMSAAQAADSRYMRLNFTVAVGPMTAGVLEAGFRGGPITNIA